ncbi:MAG: hypothetical protein A2087_11325 [Spirochaetes bacterium GWD1_61_31]|nr:MAG: hypothetical protein A2Y37_01325 [Spirochaetes bacterium GWB1_60_80]OHD33560.1 MAG: hypothetical protein A2004_06625 [Spirochaetes bacterium GWC1_61_12]OHD35708.1 MAG: hypothetical protein A2087_11325 [Spirochaetes bacterium GWD1_61_31]OHD41845.1 MAG: hypothetical protein A2Y35_04420 [Spirochaetes bacterium GWE1_60_18]OHD57825.1 MAG: hypothetical protein A2Y32_14115 [Spirochaetes bacterium GWF1_60_12]
MTKRQREFLTGARDTIPLLIGAFPFGLIYGTLAMSAGLSVAAAFAMSLFVFAGSAQFIAVGLFALGAAPPVIIVTTFIVNLRHLLYAANLLPFLGGLSRRWRLALSFMLTDEVFAVAAKRYAQVDGSSDKHWYHLGSSLAMYLNWQLCCALGILAGGLIPGIERLGLDIAMYVTFIGMVVPSVRDLPMALAVGVAALAALACPTTPGWSWPGCAASPPATAPSCGCALAV